MDQLRIFRKNPIPSRRDSKNFHLIPSENSKRGNGKKTGKEGEEEEERKKRRREEEKGWNKNRGG